MKMQRIDLPAGKASILPLRIEDLTRRELLSSALAAALLIACGDDEEDEGEGGVASPQGAFPITLTHKYGSTTIDGEPQRVVSIGYRDHEHLLAFGVRPLAVRDWFGHVHPFATFPWAKAALGDAEPVVLERSELDFEQIAGLRPDVIFGLYSGMTQETYDRLSQIAPAVPQSGDYPDWGMPWQEEVRMIGRALGRLGDAEALVGSVDAKLA